jgi:hypothetical protein
MTLEDVARLQNITLDEAAGLIERTRQWMLEEIRKDQARPFEQRLGPRDDRARREHERFQQQVCPMAIELLQRQTPGTTNLIYTYGVLGNRNYTPYTAANAELAGGKRAGRPAKADADKRSERMVLLATPADRAAILARVPAGRDFSDWALEVLKHA